MRNKLFLSLFMVISLSACQNPGVVFELPYKEDGTLLTISTYEMYEMACLNAQTGVYLVGLKGCLPCNQAETACLDFATNKKCDIYYVDMTSVTFSQDYTLPLDLTNYPSTDYMWLYQSSIYNDGSRMYEITKPEEYKEKGLLLPFLLFYKYGAIIVKTTNNFAKSLRDHIKVIPS